MAMDQDNLPTPNLRPLLGKNPMLYLENKYIDKLQHIHRFENNLEDNIVVGNSIEKYMLENQK